VRFEVASEEPKRQRSDRFFIGSAHRVGQTEVNALEANGGRDDEDDNKWQMAADAARDERISDLCKPNHK
jgi:hypothetical protein